MLLLQQNNNNNENNNKSYNNSNSRLILGTWYHFGGQESTLWTQLEYVFAESKGILALKTTFRPTFVDLITVTFLFLA